MISKQKRRLTAFIASIISMMALVLVFNKKQVPEEIPAVAEETVKPILPVVAAPPPPVQLPPPPPELDAPVLKTKQIETWVYNLEVKPTQLEWTPVADASNYTLQISSDSAFTQPFDINVSKTDFDIARLGNIRNSSLYFRVKASATPDKTESAFSEVGQIQFQHAKPIAKRSTPTRKVSSTPSEMVQVALDIITPKIKQSFVSKFYYFQKGAGKFIRLNWIGTQKDITDYNVQISTSQNFETLVMSQKTKNSSLLLQNEIPEGVYYWRVRAEKEKAASDWSNTAIFNIKVGQQ